MVSINTSDFFSVTPLNQSPSHIALLDPACKVGQVLAATPSSHALTERQLVLRVTDFVTGLGNSAETAETANTSNEEFIAAVFQDIPDCAVPLVTMLAGSPETHKSWPARAWPATLPTGSPPMETRC
jgi:hypothetical protein